MIVPEDVREVCKHAAAYGKACHEARVALNAWLMDQSAENERRMHAAIERAKELRK